MREAQQPGLEEQERAREIARSALGFISNSLLYLLGVCEEKSRA